MGKPGALDGAEHFHHMNADTGHVQQYVQSEALAFSLHTLCFFLTNSHASRCLGKPLPKTWSIWSLLS